MNTVILTAGGIVILGTVILIVRSMIMLFGQVVEGKPAGPGWGAAELIRLVVWMFLLDVAIYMVGTNVLGLTVPFWRTTIWVALFPIMIYALISIVDLLKWNIADGDDKDQFSRYALPRVIFWLLVFVGSVVTMFLAK
jgi:hypothetical protein